MLIRLLLVVVLVGALVSLTPLAYADPPDPIWIPGVWDDDDQDNVVVLATSGVHGVTASWVEISQPPLIVVASVLPQDPSSVVGTDLGPFQSRGPPSR